MSLKSILKGPTTDVVFVHYYTNGGHYGTYWSINHLSNRRNGVYCSSEDAGHNIIVKSTNLAEVKLQNHYRDRWNPSETLISHDTQFEEELEQRRDRAVIN